MCQAPGQRHILKLPWLLLCVLLTVACSLIRVDEIEKQDLVGVWKEESENCEKTSQDCSWFEFTADGIFRARNIPGEFFGYVKPYQLPSNNLFDASGTWKIELSSDPLGNHKVRLRFDRDPETGVPVYNDVLYVSGKKENMRLFAWHGDTSHRITFVKSEDLQD